jgi:hypothetical protein
MIASKLIGEVETIPVPHFCLFCRYVNFMFAVHYRGQFIEYDFGNIRLPRVYDRVWKNMDFNFDDVSQGMLSLFAVSTFEGWPGYASFNNSA